MAESASKKRGSRLSGTAKDGLLTIRIGKDEQEMLAFVAGKTGESMSEIMRRGLKNCYVLAQYGDVEW